MQTPPSKPNGLRRSVLKTVLLSYLVTTCLSPYAHANGASDILVEYSSNTFNTKSMLHSHLADYKEIKGTQNQKKTSKATQLSEEDNRLIAHIVALWTEESARKSKDSVSKNIADQSSVVKAIADSLDETPQVGNVPTKPIALLPEEPEGIALQAVASDSARVAEEMIEALENVPEATQTNTQAMIVADSEDDDSRDPEKRKSSHELDVEEITKALKATSIRLSRKEMAEVIKENPSQFLKTLIANKASFEDFEALLLEVAPDAHRKMYDAKLIDTRIYDQSFLVSFILGSAGVVTDVFAMEWFKHSIHNKTLMDGLIPLMQKTGNWIGTAAASSVFGSALEKSQNVFLSVLQKSLEVIVGDAVKVELFKWAPHLAQTVVDHTIMRASKMIKKGAAAASSFVTEKFSGKTLASSLAEEEKQAASTKKISVLEAFWDTIALNPQMSTTDIEQVLSLINPTASWILEENHLSELKVHSDFWKSGAWHGMKFVGSFARDVGITFALSPLFAIVAKRLVSDVLISKVGQPISDYITENYYVKWALEQKAKGNLAAVRAEVDALKMGLDPNYIPTSKLRELPILSTIADSIDYAKDKLQSVLGLVFSENTLNHVPVIGAPDPVQQLDMVAKLYWDQMAIGVTDAAVEGAYHPVVTGVTTVVEAIKDKMTAPKQKRVRKQRQFFDPTATGTGSDPSTYDHYDQKTGILSND